MNRDELFASIEALCPGRDDVVCLRGLGHRLAKRRAP
jgi:hypothetical protein